jgi:serine protease Do
MVVVRRTPSGGTEQKTYTLEAAPRPEDEATPAGRTEEAEAGAREDPPTPKLGMKVQRVTPELRDQLGLEGDDGVAVTSVTPDGPAETARIRPGDVILEVNHQPVRKPDDLVAAIAKLKENDVVVMRVRRGDQAGFVTVRIGGK